MRVWNLKSVHGARRTKQSLSYKKFTNLISLAGPIKKNNCYILQAWNVIIRRENSVPILESRHTLAAPNNLLVMLVTIVDHPLYVYWKNGVEPSELSEAVSGLLGSVHCPSSSGIEQLSSSFFSSVWGNAGGSVWVPKSETKVWFLKLWHSHCQRSQTTCGILSAPCELHPGLLRCNPRTNQT